MQILQDIKQSLLHLIFPHVCAGCGTDLSNTENQLCLRCAAALPQTFFELHGNNPVEKKLWGRLPVQAATAQYYFTRESLVQQIVHEIKYRNNTSLGRQIGRMMGRSLLQSGRFMVDVLIPLPLFPEKEKKRGYNQSMVLCRGIADEMQIPVLNDIVIRPQFTETQTKKGRIERWKNMDGKFVLKDESAIAGKHVLLIDDVITTGATLESCGNEILKAQNTRLSIACVCDATR